MDRPGLGAAGFTDKGLVRLIDALTLVFVNEQEAALYSGTNSVEAALPFWRQRRPIVVMKLGAAGSRTLGSGGEYAAPAPRVRSIDTTGAGDAFNGGFLVSWMHSMPLRQCLVAGNRVGATSTTKAGGIDALPKRRVRR